MPYMQIKVLPLHYYGYKKDSKQHIEGGSVALSGRCHPLLDVSRIRLQAGRGGTASQDELDLDAAVVPLWHLWHRCSRMEMEAVAGAIGEKPAQHRSITPYSSRMH